MKILLAIDDSPCSEAAVDAVIARYRPENAEVHVLHVDEWPKDLPTSLAFAEGPNAAANIVAMREEVRIRGRNLTDRAADRLREAHFRATSEVREGDPRHVVLDCAAERHADVIVLGSHGRRGIQRFLLGSVSESVVRHASCSVDVVREPA